jgi:hypothetical protein
LTNEQRKADKRWSFQHGDVRWAKSYQCKNRKRLTVHQAKVLTNAAARRAARAQERSRGDE